MQIQKTCLAKTDKGMEYSWASGAMCWMTLVSMNLLHMAVQSCQKMAHKEAGLFDYSEIFLGGLTHLFQRTCVEQKPWRGLISQTLISILNPRNNSLSKSGISRSWGLWHAKSLYSPRSPLSQGCYLRCSGLWKVKLF